MDQITELHKRLAIHRYLGNTEQEIITKRALDKLIDLHLWLVSIGC